MTNKFLIEIKKDIVSNSLSDDEISFLLRYITLNKNEVQVELNSYDEVVNSIVNDFVIIKTNIKGNEEIPGYNNKLLELIDLHDRYNNFLELNDLLDIYYDLEILKTKCNIKSNHADIVYNKLERKKLNK